MISKIIASLGLAEQYDKILIGTEGEIDATRIKGLNDLDNINLSNGPVLVFVRSKKGADTVSKAFYIGKDPVFIKVYSNKKIEDIQTNNNCIINTSDSKNGIAIALIKAYKPEIIPEPEQDKPKKKKSKKKSEETTD